MLCEEHLLLFWQHEIQRAIETGKLEFARTPNSRGGCPSITDVVTLPFTIKLEDQ